MVTPSDLHYGELSTAFSAVKRKALATIATGEVELALPEALLTTIAPGTSLSFIVTPIALA